ncbi:MAG: quinolinate synthase NadA, partial [Pseudomonadota bacterium]
EHHILRLLFTECSMSDNVAIENPEVNFVRPCNLCPHMKKITLEGILHCLETKTHEVLVDEDIAERARLAVQRMIDLPPLGTVSNFSARIGGDVIAVEHR